MIRGGKLDGTYFRATLCACFEWGCLLPRCSLACYFLPFSVDEVTPPPSILPLAHLTGYITDVFLSCFPLCVCFSFSYLP